MKDQTKQPQPKNASIEILQAQNGFIVRKPYDMNYDRSGSPQESHVFRTMRELLKFVSDNFTHRGNVTLNDNKK